MYTGNAYYLIKSCAFYLVLFSPFFALIIVIRFILSMLSTLLCAYYSVEFNGNFSAETRFKKYWKLSRRNRRKICWKVTQKNINKFEKKNLLENFFRLNNIFNKNTNLSQKCLFENIVYVSRYWQKTLCVNSGFRQFLSEFLIFLKTGFSCWNSHYRDRLHIMHRIVCPCVGKYKAYDDYICKTGTKRKKVKMRNFLNKLFVLSVLGSNYNWYRLQ